MNNVLVSDRDQEILTKYLFDGLNQADIAKEYGLTQSGISRLIRARLGDV